MRPAALVGSANGLCTHELRRTLKNNKNHGGALPIAMHKQSWMTPKHAGIVALVAITIVFTHCWITMGLIAEHYYI